MLGKKSQLRGSCKGESCSDLQQASMNQSFAGNVGIVGGRRKECVQPLWKWG